MRSIKNLENLKNKKILLRVDFNVPVNGGVLGDTYRIESHKETVSFLRENGGIVVLVSHRSSKEGFEEILEQISGSFGEKPIFIKEIDEIPNIISGRESDVFLLDNIRKWPGEENNDENFAKKLASYFDIYVNDAFSVSHRNHASIAAVTKFLPSYAGFLLWKEVSNLERVINEPLEGKIIILGGAKTSTKIPVVKNFLDKAENILIAGALSNIIFKYKGINIGKSFVEDVDINDLLKGIDLDNSKIILPEDIVVSEDKSGKSIPEIIPVQDLDENQLILDIGPETIKKFSQFIKDAKMVIFNGPLGLAEVERFSMGTKIILNVMANSDAFTVIGGGDTLALIEKMNLLDKFDYVSTGGGAMLEFLSGNKLPGLEALGYYG